jgi:hypothetical protein
MYELIGVIVLLAFLLVAVFFVAVKYFGPLPRKSPKRLVAGIITVLSVPATILTQVRVETRFRLATGYAGPRFASKVIGIEAALCLWILIYFTYLQNADR